jgi:nucleoid DNA-binding protein
MDILGPVPPPKHNSDKSNLELVHEGHLKIVKENINARAEAVFDQMNRVSDCSITDIMLAIAHHGGRVEVEGFGVFTVHQMKGRWKRKKGVWAKGETYEDRAKWVPGRLWVEFHMDWRLRDLLNEDWFCKDPEISAEPRRNMSVFRSAKSLQL